MLMIKLFNFKIKGKNAHICNVLHLYLEYFCIMRIAIEKQKNVFQAHHDSGAVQLKDLKQQSYIRALQFSVDQKTIQLSIKNSFRITVHIDQDRSQLQSK